MEQMEQRVCFQSSLDITVSHVQSINVFLMMVMLMFHQKGQNLIQGLYQLQKKDDYKSKSK